MLLLLPPVLIVLLCIGIGPLPSSEVYFDKINVGFSDPENSIYSAMISDLLINDARYTDFLFIDNYEYDEAAEMMENGELDAMIVLPDNFVEDMSNGINRPILVVCNESTPLKAAVIKELMESAASQITAAQSAINTVWRHSDLEGLDNAALDRKWNGLIMNYMLLSFSRDRYTESRFVSAYGEYGMEHFIMASVLSLFIFLMCMTCINPVIQNYSRNIHKRLFACGRSPFRIALVSQLPIFLLSFAQALLSFVALSVISGAGASAGTGAGAGIAASTATTTTAAAEAAGAAVNTAAGAAGANLSLVGVDGSSVTSILLATAAAAAVCFLASSVVYLACLLLKNTESAEIFSITFIILSAVLGGTVIPYAYLPGFFERIGVLSYSRWTQSALLSAVFGSPQSAGTLIALTAGVSVLLLFTSALIIKKDTVGV